MIYWNGCSFVRGMEVKDRPKDIFANIVSEEFNQPWWDNAKVGGSNDRIWRTTVDDMIRKPADLVIIVWSGFNRFEFLDNHSTWRSAVWIRYLFNRSTLDISDRSEVHMHPRMTLDQWKKQSMDMPPKVEVCDTTCYIAFTICLVQSIFLKQKESHIYFTICPMDNGSHLNLF